MQIQETDDRPYTIFRRFADGKEEVLSENVAVFLLGTLSPQGDMRLWATEAPPTVMKNIIDHASVRCYYYPMLKEMREKELEQAAEKSHGISVARTVPPLRKMP